ncbi:nucleolar protein 8 [Orycteropus afer afer]|uniref:Nucleolar protein 8 n=1 Tax=Orycteropus afer afer TaxID=1230840 RepID=A0A8B7AT83_ORYAF|nr:nucleolar protein 8 [Orycteropus afer afer]
MNANREMKRLYVGGLSQAISQADLQNQFSRFGEVSDVEIITRRDDHGNPQKIFAYINIRVAEADLKKCMSVLNKTKWKGGTLEIQQAKESFLHRLAQEREDAKAKKDNSRTGNTDLLKKMGVVDLHMKAVPGTEVPGHKNWVVSKFGRVLPVLHLKNQLKHKIIKYDPSKYCHNLKKIGENSTNTIPITNLTWKLEGGNDPMTKKRRGEFSNFHRPPKKIKKEHCGGSATRPLAICPVYSSVMDGLHLMQQQAAQNTPHDFLSLSESPCVPNSDHQKPKTVPFQTYGLKTDGNKNSMSDDDSDFKDELRAVISGEENLEKTMWSSIKELKNDPFVVVRDDLKSDVHKLYFSTSLGVKNSIPCHLSNDNVTGNYCGYDSGDTDEIIAMKKNIGKVKNTEFLNMEKSICKKISLKGRKSCESSDDSVEIQKKEKKKAVSNGIKLNCKSPSDSSSGEDADSAESEGGKEYDAMMKNCVHVKLTLADLEQLSYGDAEAAKENTESDSQETTTCCQFIRASKNLKIPGNPHRGKQCIHPEDIVTSLLEGKKNILCKEKLKENKFQAFKGIGSLYGKESWKNSLKEGVSSNGINKDQSSLNLENPSSISMEKGFSYADGSSRELIPCQHTKKAYSSNHTEPQNRQASFESQGLKVMSLSNSEKGSRSTASTLLLLKGKNSLSLDAKIYKMDFDKDGHRSTPKTEDSSEEKTNSHSRTLPEKSPKFSSSKDIPSLAFSRKTRESRSGFQLTVSNLSNVPKYKHAQDNQKRLAALDARQKAKEKQKKLVHNALANLDDHSEVRATHIIFGSDSESERKETSIQELSHPEELVKESICKASGKLFDNSGDEKSDSEDDSNRFKIKPQFEGRAGQKLMDLQSHFGTDNRFRMDSRFLESDSEEEKEVNEKKTEEEELAAEKNKALDVVQRVLYINLNNSTCQGSITAKKFKDIIHYDPTRHDHVTFERKRDDKPKESKAKRKKKREESEKLPEVSKEMYYNIATDLKERLQTTKGINEKKENVPWNEDCGGDKTEVNDPASLKNGDEEPIRFTFSFFDSDAKDVKEETYRAETVKPGKIAWHGNPCFQDSSSEEEDTTIEIDPRKPNPGEVSIPEKVINRWFFFSKNDERLHGSKLFWREAESNMSRNYWEAQTNNLRKDCRKKHKDAKRKMKPK